MKINAVCRQCRRAGVKLFLKGERCFSPKCSMIKRKYPPGVHGPKGMSRLSEFGLQLREKQKAKRVYGIKEKQFRKYFLTALKKKGQPGEELIYLLESRLDNVVFRFGFAASRSQARQIITHGHIKVNKRKVNIPSCQIKKGDVVEIKQKSKKETLFTNLAKKLTKIKPPSWLKIDVMNLTGEVVSMPASEEFEQNINTSLIVEFYSR